MSAFDAPPPASGRGVRVAGYAAVFDYLDRGGDIVRKGAFARALQRGGEVPLLLQHRAGTVVGKIEHLSEDTRGLRVIARVDDAATAKSIGRGYFPGLSFGYRVRDARTQPHARELVDLDLVEVSLVARPMQPKARVHAIER